jgi:dienelactone hydrolase
MENRTRKTFLSVLLTWLMMVSMGCVVRHDPSPEKPHPSLEIPLFSYERKGIQPRVQRLKEENTFWVEKVTFPSSLVPHWVTAYHYIQKAGENPPTIIVLPILGGNYFFSENCARYLARHGFCCLRFERTANPLDGEKGLMHTKMVLRHAIIDIRRSIDWLSQRGEGNLNRIGVLGISMGAIVAALALEVEPRINSAAILLGGGDIATIFATSKENLVVRFRAGVMRTHGIDLQQFHKEATRILAPVDPLTYASRSDPKYILMVNARFDRVVPPPCPEKLWEALGRPLWIRIPTGHDSSALLLPYLRYRVLKHFREYFAGE